MARVKGMFEECCDALGAAGVKSPTERQALTAQMDLATAKALVYHYHAAQRNKSRSFTPKTDAQLREKKCNEEAQLAAQKGKNSV